MDAFTYIIIAIIGLCIGSFLNVIIYRYPIMLMRSWKKEAHDFLELEQKPSSKPFNLCLPRSHCPKCKALVSWYNNIPIISFLLQWGRCQHCKNSISLRYPLVELINAIAYCGLFFHFGLSTAFFLSAIYSSGLICLFLIDYDHQLLPDDIVIAFLWLGLFANSIHTFVSLKSAVYGALVGYLMLWCIAKLYLLIRKRDGMGHGDFKMLAMIGAWTGMSSLPLSLLIACFLSLAINGLLITCKRIQFDQATPFGPFLAISAFILLIWQQPLMLMLAQLLGLNS